MSAGSLVYFDLETTSLRKDAEITQIAAVWRDKRFNCYVLPEGDISHGATSVTGIEKDGDVLVVNGEEVDAFSTYEAVNDFISWLNDLDIHTNNGYPILIGHNAHNFDIPRLLSNASDCGLYDKVIDSVDGFIDTLPLFRDSYPDLDAHSQQALLDAFGLESYDPHNALEDVRALRALMTRTGLFREKFLLQQYFYCL